MVWPNKINQRSVKIICYKNVQLWFDYNRGKRIYFFFLLFKIKKKLQTSLYYFLLALKNSLYKNWVIGFTDIIYLNGQLKPYVREETVYIIDQIKSDFRLNIIKITFKNTLRILFRSNNVKNCQIDYLKKKVKESK